MKRKFFGIFLIIFGIVLIGVFIYLFFFANTTPADRGAGQLPDVPFTDPDFTGGDTTGTGSDPFTDPFSDLPDVIDQPQKLLFQITDHPITGYTVNGFEKEVLQTITRLVDIENEDGTVTTEEFQEEIINRILLPQARYHDRVGGQIYEARIDGNNVLKNQLIDNPINGIFESKFAGNNTVYMRYFDSDDRVIKTYQGSLSSSIATAFCPHDFTQSLQEGDAGRQVEIVQNYISQVITPSQPLTPARFDQAMVVAVKEFQTARDIRIDAIIKEETNQELQEVCLEVEQRRLEAQVVDNDEVPFSLSGIFIDDNILQLAISPSGQSMFQLVDRPGNALGVVSGAGGDNREVVYELNYRDWLIEYPRADVLSFTTKPSGLVGGASYLYDYNANDFAQILSNLNGLMTLPSPDATKVLYAYSTNETGIQTALLNVEGRNRSRLSVRTFPEKCVWHSDNVTVYCAVPQNIPAALYPDRWYQNQIVFDDALWEINTQTNETRVIEDFRQANVDMDILNLQLDANEEFLFFTDQKTGFLWARDLRG